MKRLLLVTPPFLQPNAPYPATAYLKGYLGRQGIETEQYDLSTALLCRIFSRDFLERIFDRPLRSDDENIRRIRALRHRYLSTIEPVMRFLQGREPALAYALCAPDYLPQGGRLLAAGDLTEVFGPLGTADCAKYLATLYLQDLSDYLRAELTERFEIVRYAERIALSVPRFERLGKELSAPPDAVEAEMLALLEERMNARRPEVVGFTVPFPGNLFAALRCCQHIKRNHPGVVTVLGGGYPTTELRQMTDRGIFDYADHIILDDGEEALAAIARGDRPKGAYTHGRFVPAGKPLKHVERGCPDFTGLDHGLYFSLLEVANPMHRLWSDGRWNKMMLAHGCYWARCAFCDTSLDYIGRFDSAPAPLIADWMAQVARDTDSTAFHFTDEAAPPALLKALSLELLRRKVRYTWWTNIRFEKAFTTDLCRLMAEAGCIAVSGGLEVADNRLLALIGKGIDVEQATLTLRNFYDAGIRTHAYLMYGFPTETLQETVDALETVRQLFRAGLLDSAYWHRFAMTVHSPCGRSPETYGVSRSKESPAPFANNECSFREKRGYDLHAVGEALRTALAHYLAGDALDRPVVKWFTGKMPAPRVEPTLVSDQLLRADASRLYDDRARLIWTGGIPERTPTGIVLHGTSERKTLALPEAIADWITDLLARCADLTQTVTLADAKAGYAALSDEPFAVFYHAKKWDSLRRQGLLQI